MGICYRFGLYRSLPRSTNILDYIVGAIVRARYTEMVRTTNRLTARQVTSLMQKLDRGELKPEDRRLSRAMGCAAPTRRHDECSR